MSSMSTRTVKSMAVDIRNHTRWLHTSDILVIGFLSLLTVLNLVFSERIPHWGVLVCVNLGIIGFISWLGFVFIAY